MKKSIIINRIISISNYTNKVYPIKMGKKKLIELFGAMSYSQYEAIGQKALIKILAQILQYEKNNSSKEYYSKMIKECL